MIDVRWPWVWMTDPRLLMLSDAAYRTLSQLYSWSVGNRTDGWVPLDVIPFIPRAHVECVPELAQRDLVTVTDGRLFLIDFPDTQTSREQLEGLEAKRDADRARDRERKRKAKAKAARDSTRNPAGGSAEIPPETQDQEQDQEQALTRESPTHAQAREDDPADDDPEVVDVTGGWPKPARPRDPYCETPGHSGCGWQPESVCPDCIGGAADGSL